MPFGRITHGPKEHNVLDGGRDPHGKGAILWGLSGPLKGIGSLLRCTHVGSKRDYSILNNGTTCDAAFWQNLIITCFSLSIVYETPRIPIVTDRRTNRQMNGQTPGHSIYSASTASCGNSCIHCPTLNASFFLLSPQ